MISRNDTHFFGSVDMKAAIRADMATLGIPQASVTRKDVDEFVSVAVLVRGAPCALPQVSMRLPFHWLLNRRHV